MYQFTNFAKSEPKQHGYYVILFVANKREIYVSKIYSD